LTDAVILLPFLILVVRTTGLRSFAKMSAHDFTVTVATGSVVAATVVNPDTPWWMGALALLGLLFMQVAIGWARIASKTAQRVIDNEPLVLLQDGVVDDAAMKVARVTHDDLRQKLRLAGITRFRDAQLVILETTGDVTVLREAPEPAMLREVRALQA
jgi:uncharacterized membrane protein YcaP (DUF421 family)